MSHAAFCLCAYWAVGRWSRWQRCRNSSIRKKFWLKLVARSRGELAPGGAWMPCRICGAYVHHPRWELFGRRWPQSRTAADYIHWEKPGPVGSYIEDEWGGLWATACHPTCKAAKELDDLEVDACNLEQQLQALCVELKSAYTWRDRSHLLERLEGIRTLAHKLRWDIASCSEAAATSR